MKVKLSTDMEDPTAIPYFLWDEPMNVAQLMARLQSSSYTEHVRLIAKIMREARDIDVWKFTTPSEVWRLWPDLNRKLGRRRAFWEFLFEYWRIEGLIG